jgi:hypothetical protein
MAAGVDVRSADRELGPERGQLACCERRFDAFTWQVGANRRHPESQPLLAGDVADKTERGLEMR